MARFEPATTVYLCTGTGMDMANSIWWHRFAYPDTTATTNQDATWWNTCFQFFKAHSIANGHWYCTYTDPMKGYFKVGRIPLNNNDIPMGDSTLGNSAKQQEMENADLPFAETIQAIDYIIFANDGQEGGTSDIKYAFVDKIVSINYNVAIVYFTIDAIMTYQKFFHFGKCNVARDMQFQEWDTDSCTFSNTRVNAEPENYAPSDNDYIAAKCINGNADFNLMTQLGYYNAMLCLSDVSLAESDITANVNFSALPSFIPSESTKVGTGGSDTELGVGIYYIQKRVNNAFKLLGSYNAMEHLLYSYVVPRGLISITREGSSTEPLYIAKTSDVIRAQYANKQYNLNIPVYYDDNVEHDISALSSSSSYFPMNYKVMAAPYTYISLTDRQGSSMEIPLQTMIYGSDAAGDGSRVSDATSQFALSMRYDMEIAPNTASEVRVMNSASKVFGRISGLKTLWQMPTYAMTPNGSGYNQSLVNAVVQDNAKQELYRLGKRVNAIAVANSMSSVAQSTLNSNGVQGLFDSAFTPEVTGLFTGGMNAIATAGRAATTAKNMYYSSLVGSSAGQEANAIYNGLKAEAEQVFGLPKVAGGLAQGYTARTIDKAEYEYYFVHIRTDLIKNLDTMFSVFGYAQNKYRFPHINIRKRWCYVECADVNIIPQPANNYNMGGVPYYARDQINARMMSGITFWNVRHALMGDADSGASTVQSWDDGAIQAAKNCKFVRNYGDTPDCDIMKENRSYIGGYASDYTDDVNQVGNVT